MKSTKLGKLLMVAIISIMMTTTVFAAQVEGDVPVENTESSESSGEAPSEPGDTHVCEDNKVLDHTEEATCTKEGKEVYKCSKCGRVVEEKTIAKKDHNFSGTETITKQPTCYVEGTKTIQCTGCSKTQTMSISKTSHQMSGWQSHYKAQTCKEKDKEINKCLNSGCTHQEIRETNSTGPCIESSERKNIKAATCKEEGYTGDSVCKNCGKILVKGTKIAKTEHSADSTLKNKKDATCSKQGYSGDLVCKHCGTVMEKGVTIAMTSHKASDTLKNKKDASCKEEGYTGDEVCRDCGTVLEKGSSIPKKEHEKADELKNIKEATCSTPGYSGDKVCKNCGEVIEKGGATVTSAHKPKLIKEKKATCKDEGYSGDEICEVCAFKISVGKEIPKGTNHDYGEWTIIQEATETTKGTETRECNICHTVESRNIPKLNSEDEEETTEAFDDKTEETETFEEETFVDDGNTDEETNTAVIIALIVGLVGLSIACGALVYFKKFR